MFQLHDRTRRSIQGLLFFVLCIAPTLGITAWCIARRLPGQVRAEAQRLSWQLGVKVELDDVRYPRPGVTRYENLVASDPETGRKLLACRSVDAFWSGSEPRRVLVLTTFEPQFETDTLGDVWQLVDRLLASHFGGSEIEVQWKAEKAMIAQSESPCLLEDVQARLAPLDPKTEPQSHTPSSQVEGMTAELHFRTEGSQDKASVWVRRVRNIAESADSRPIIEFTMNTGPAPLPCAALAAGFDGAKGLGSGCHFQGSICGHRIDGQWAYQLSGEFIDVELDALFAQHAPGQKLTGKARLSVADARYSRGAWQRIAGSLDARAGRVSRSLVEGVARQLNLYSDIRPEDPEEFDYSQLAAQFLLDPQGLRLRGTIGKNQAVLANRWGELVWGPRQLPIPAAALAQALRPTTSAAPSSLQAFLDRLPPGDLLHGTSSSGEILPTSHQAEEAGR